MGAFPVAEEREIKRKRANRFMLYNLSLSLSLCFTLCGCLSISLHYTLSASLWLIYMPVFLWAALGEALGALLDLTFMLLLHRNKHEKSTA